MAKLYHIPDDYIPLITTNFNKNRAQWMLLGEFWFVLAAILLTNQFYYRWLFSLQIIWMVLLLPISLYGFLWQIVFGSLLSSWIIYKILSAVEPPKEGIFSLNSREFQYYTIRFWVTYYAIWMLRAAPIPWADMFAFRMFGCKIGKDVVLYDSWIDPEFVEIEDSVMLSLNAAIFSHCIRGDEFIVQKVLIKRAAIVGAQSIVAPGTTLGEGAVIGVGSVTMIGQQLNPYKTHVGLPCTKELPIKLMEDE